MIEEIQAELLEVLHAVTQDDFKRCMNSWKNVGIAVYKLKFKVFTVTIQELKMT